MVTPWSSPVPTAQRIRLQEAEPRNQNNEKDFHRSVRFHGAFAAPAVCSPLPASASRLRNASNHRGKTATYPGLLGRRRRRRNQMLNNDHGQLATLLFANGLLV